MKQMETSRLILRKFNADDWQDLYEYLSNPEVVKYEPYDVYSKKDCVEEAKRRAREEESPYWAVCLKGNNKLIGNIYFAKLDPDEYDTYALGYAFNTNYQGNGFATEASKQIIQYGFEEKKAHRIVAGVNVENEASWRVLERLSMRREACFYQYAFHKRTESGEPIWIDSYRYAILASEYFLNKK